MKKVVEMKDELIRELAKMGMKVNIIPEYRYGVGIYDFIDNGINKAINEGEDLEEFIGSMSMDDDNEFIELDTSEEAIAFWENIIKERREENQEEIIKMLKNANSINIQYIRFY